MSKPRICEHEQIGKKGNLRSLPSTISKEDQAVRGKMLQFLDRDEMFIDVGIVAVMPDGSVTTAFEGNSRFALIGGLEWLKERILKEMES